MDTERRDWTIEKKGFLSSYKKYIVRKQNRAARQQAPLYFTLFKYFLNALIETCYITRCRNICLLSACE